MSVTFLLLLYLQEFVLVSSSCSGYTWSNWKLDSGPCLLQQIGGISVSRKEEVRQSQYGLVETRYKQCKNVSSVVGYEDYPGVIHVDGPYWIIVIPYAPYVVKEDGFLSEWTYNAFEKKQIQFQLYDMPEANIFTLKYTTEYITPSVVDEWESLPLENPVAVKKGWFIGMKWDQGAPVKYSHEVAADSIYAFHGDFEVGDNATAAAINFGAYGYRHYKVRAKILISDI